MIRALAAALWLSACAAVGPAAGSTEAVIAAERGFAADAAARGPKAAFLAAASEDGVMVRKGRVLNARAFVGGWPDEGGSLAWWPVLAGAARSGDFGFTTGPAVWGKDEGFSDYLTVWRREADGRWRWLIDMGAKTAKSPLGPQTPVRIAGAAVRGSSAEAAFAEVRAVEARLIAGMAEEYAKAHAPWLAPEARVFGLEPVAAETPAAVKAALATRPKAITSKPLGGGAASSGDLAYTYGLAEWAGPEKPVTGSYLRVWQRRPQGWRIVADLISED